VCAGLQVFDEILFGELELLQPPDLEFFGRGQVGTFPKFPNLLIKSAMLSEKGFDVVP
jgi:hypothetical protein